MTGAREASDFIWLMLDGLDRLTLKLSSPTYFSDPAWISVSGEAVGKVNGGGADTTEALAALFSLTPRPSADELLFSSLQTLQLRDRLGALPPEAPLHVFTILSERCNDGGLDPCIRTLELIRETAVQQVALHFLIPPADDKNLLLSLDCFDLVQNWITTKSLSQRFRVRSVSGTLQAFSQPLSYFRRLSSTPAIASDKEARTVLQEVLRQGRVEAALPLLAFGQGPQLTHDSLSLSVVTRPRFLAALEAFTSPQCTLLYAPHQTPSLHFLSQLQKAGPVTLVDRSPDQVFRELLQHSLPASSPFKWFRETPSSVEGPCLIYDNSLLRVLQSGLPQEMKHAFQETMERLSSGEGFPRRSGKHLVTGVTPYPFSLDTWTRLGQPPEIPAVYSSKDVLPTATSFTPADFVKAVLEDLGLTLPAGELGKEDLVR